jgi:proprotein convertase subtilisin/kexin type 5
LQTCPLQTVASLILSSTLYQCSSCSANCLQCTSVGVCILCGNQTYLYNSGCLASCPAIGSQQLYPNLNHVCSPCDCLTCVNWSYNCTSCSGSLIYDSTDFACLTQCEDGQFNKSGVCQSCSNLCILCSAINYCQRCQ